MHVKYASEGRLSVYVRASLFSRPDVKRALLGTGFVVRARDSLLTYDKVCMKVCELPGSTFRFVSTSNK